MTQSPYGVRFLKEDKNREILVPNLTPEFSRVMQAAIEGYGYNMKILPLADESAISLGKYYVHNDICFPAQINVGEVLAALKTGAYDPAKTAMGLSKNCKSCRALQYYALARRALDRAGYPQVPIITSGTDVQNIHPGFKLGLRFRLRSLQGMLYVDALNEMRQRLLPYEKNPGDTEAVHARFMDEGMAALRKNFRHVKRALARAVQAFNTVEADRTKRRPVVGIVGEILVNYHPSANYGIANYLLKNGMEPYLPPLLDFFRQDVVVTEESAERGFSKYPFLDRLEAGVMRFVFNRYVPVVEQLLKDFKYFEERTSIDGLRDYGAEVISSAFSSGEGWLLPGEIIAMIKKGVRSFVIVQPFGCLPNHISGRGIIRAVKDRYPEVQILSLDYDPDISLGNIENRLQMLIMGARERHHVPLEAAAGT